MAGSPEQCKTMMRRLLSACVEGGFVVDADCDEVVQQFDDFIHMCVKGELENFCVADDRLDTFLRSRMAANYPKLNLDKSLITWTGLRRKGILCQQGTSC